MVDVSFASPPEVPRKINFAGMVLTLSEAARRDIQHDVNLICGHEKYFNVKAERAKTYFPIIKQIFEREGLPEDFKYLAIQESALIGDAVSVSNAVGFWQFKDYTAREIGL
ncbi:MAG: lytic transglycosylase, partial [Candidatus Nephrothrix sp. EaCA]